MNDRLADVITKLPEAQAETAIVQAKWRIDWRERLRASRASAAMAFRERDLRRKKHRAGVKRDPLVYRTVRHIRMTTTRCCYCARSLTREQVTIDHVIPLSRGGRHISSNLTGCCLQCNMRKSARLDWKPLPAWFEPVEFD